MHVSEVDGKESQKRERNRRRGKGEGKIEEGLVVDLR